MPKELPKAYEAKNYEDKVYKSWEDAKAFTPKANSEKDPFTISMPPPNATGTLHLGHGVMLAVEDILTRFKRMTGHETLWVPGTDHAGIATESKVERLLNEKGSGRNILGREKFIEEVKDFVQNSQDTIKNQTRKMGASCDWSRERYTLDEGLSTAVSAQFIKMYEDGLVYRGHRIVNWDPKMQTTVADDEIERIEEKAKFYYFQYGPFVIGTSRPETKFGDKYVVMHPDDDRYKEYKHGQEVEVEWIFGKITATILKDECIDMELGTGAMTITPWHDTLDFDLAQKYKLPKQQIIDFDGKLMDVAGEFAGMDIWEGRDALVKKLDEKGLLVRVDEEYIHQKAVNYRGGGVIEPQIKEQWFIDVNKPIPAGSAPLVDMGDKIKVEGKSLKQIMLEVVRNGQVRIIPERFEKTYFHWIENLRDWCISRQIWFGHRIPVWYDKSGNPHAEKLQKVNMVRHGESEANVGDFAYGITDSPLTELGRRQAKDAAQQFKDKKISKIIASNLSRSKETAQIIAHEIGYTPEIEIWEDSHEMDLGDMEMVKHFDGKGCAQMAHEAQTGEGIHNLFKRAKKVIDKLKNQNADGEIIIISHANFMFATSMILQSIPYDRFLEEGMYERFRQPNCGNKEFYVTCKPKTNKNKVCFVRHGQTQHNVELRACGVTDISITSDGEIQASETGEKLNGRKVTKIITSPLIRTQQTAKLIAKEIGYEGRFEIWDEVIEYDFGEMEGAYPEEGSTKPNHIKKSIEKGVGEGLDSMFARAKATISKLKKEKADGEIIVVAHGAFLRALNMTLHNIPQERYFDEDISEKFRMGNCDFFDASFEQNNKNRMQFIRHGEKIWDEDIQDFKLTELGHQQAKDRGEALKQENITKIITSPFHRCIETATHIKNAKNLDIETWEELREINIKYNPEYANKKIHISKENFPKFSEETLSEVLDRAKVALDRLEKIQTGGGVAVVAHSFITSVIFAVKAGVKTEDEFWEFRKDWSMNHCESKPLYLNQEEFTQDPDTLDTWFSSGLWTFSTLGWPAKTTDLEYFHPTSCMETGYDIIFFWVARMILMTTYATRQVPFKDVYLHGLVKDRNGKKMSKSNPETCIDPLEMIDQYGADAVRLALIIGTSPGADSKMYEEKIKGYRNFVNKIWNTARFALMNVEDMNAICEPKSVADKYILSKMQTLIESTTEKIENYNLSEAGSEIYEFLWHEFADWYLEISKKNKNEGVILHVLKTILKLIHPFTPYVTEAIWSELGESTQLISEDYPIIFEAFIDPDSEKKFEKIKDAIYQTRNICQGNEIAKANVIYHVPAEDIEMFTELSEAIKMLAWLGDIKIIEGKNIFVEIVGLDAEQEKKRLEKEIQKLTPYITGITKKLSNEKFIENADSDLVLGERQKLENASRDKKTYENRLKSL